MSRRSYSEQERQIIKERLLSTALECIAEKGLIHASVDLLCKNVGISKSFFYSFFSSKEDLVLQALRYQQPRLLQYAQSLMDDPRLSWRESIERFLQNCCYGNKTGIAVLSIEEERDIFRRLTRENYHAFQQEQIVFYQTLLTIFDIDISKIDPRLFGNLALTMMMVYKAMPDGLPFLFADIADDMVTFQIDALINQLERAKNSTD